MERINIVKDNQIASELSRIVALLTETNSHMVSALAAIHDAQLGQPSAGSMTPGRSSGGASVVERAALSRLDGKDPAAATRARIEAQVLALGRMTMALAIDVAGWQPRPPAPRDVRASDGQGAPGCQSCARWDGPDGQGWWSPVFLRATTCARRLARPMDLCRPCYDNVAARGTLS